MKTTRIYSRLGVLGAMLLVVGGVSRSYGVIIGFQGTGVAPMGVISPVPLPYTESGFTIKNGSPAAESGIFGANTGGVANSGSDFLGWHFNGVIVLEQVGGGLFTLNAFDAGHIGLQGGLPAILPMQVTGNLGGGGTVVVNVNYGIPWSTFILPATFTGLSSVEFKTSLDGGGGIDNIRVNETTGVPETGASLILLSVALVPLAMFKRRALAK